MNYPGYCRRDIISFPKVYSHLFTPLFSNISKKHGANFLCNDAMLRVLICCRYFPFRPTQFFLSINIRMPAPCVDKGLFVACTPVPKEKELALNHNAYQGMMMFFTPLKRWLSKEADKSLCKIKSASAEPHRYTSCDTSFYSPISKCFFL